MRRVLCPQLIARDEERAALRQALERAEAGHGGVIFLLGEPGIGKSRLARQVADDAPGPVLWGRAVASNAPVAYRPLSEALLSAFRSTPRPPSPDLAPFLPALGRLVPNWDERSGSGASATAETDQSPVLLGEALIRVLAAMFGTTPSVMVLEDLHWADQDTLDVVEYMADNLAGSPVVCVVTVRTGEDSAAESLARTLHSRRASTLLDPQRLSPADTTRMAMLSLSVEQLPPALEHLVVSEAEGIPFLVEELLAGLMDAGDLESSPAGLTLSPGARAVPPPTFAQTVWRRTGRLGPHAEPVLRAAAILGHRFDWRLLPAVAGVDEDRTAKVLEGAVQAQLLKVEPGGGEEVFAFRHALTREAVLQRMVPPERRALAARALTTVEAEHPGLPGDWCQTGAALAETAGDHPRAFQLLVELGRRALQGGALATAEATLERARQEAPDAAARNVADESLTEALALAGKTDRVFEVGGELLASLERAGVPTSRPAEVHLRLARAAIAAGRWMTALEHIEQAESRADGEGALRSRAGALKAQAVIMLGRVEDAARFALDALDGAERTGLHEVACEALEVIGRCARTSDLAAAGFERAFEIADRNGLALWRIRALHELGTIDLNDDADTRRLEAARAAAADAGALALVAVLDLQIAAALLTQFRPDAALQAATSSVDLSKRLKLSTLGVGLVMLATAHAQQGDRRGSEAVCAEALAVAGDDPNVTGGVWGWARPTLALLADDRELALRCLDTAMEHLRTSVTTNPYPYRSLWALLRTLSGPGGDAARSEVAASQAAIPRDQRAMLIHAEAVDLGRAGRGPEAEAAFARADAELARYQGPGWERHLARRLVAEAAIQDGWGDPLAWLTEAVPFFAGMGHNRLASACRSLLRAQGVVLRRRPPPEDVPPGVAGLGISRREAEVLALLAEGLSNPQIAYRLYLSPRTVESHVESIGRKVGIHRRSQLVAFAARLSSGA